MFLNLYVQYVKGVKNFTRIAHCNLAKCKVAYCNIASCKIAKCNIANCNCSEMYGWGVVTVGKCTGGEL